MDDVASWTPPPPAPPTRRSRRMVVGIVVAVAALFGIGLAGCGALLAAFDPGPIDKIKLPTRHAFAPIPIPQAACPFLRRVHDTAARAGQSWWYAFYASFDDTSVSKAQVAAVLRSFDVALSDAVPHVPPPVAAQLTEVRHHVRAGERLLKKVDTAPEYAGRVSQQVNDGTLALGDASDLVGDACGFEVIPAIDTSLPVG